MYILYTLGFSDFVYSATTFKKGCMSILCTLYLPWLPIHTIDIFLNLASGSASLIASIRITTSSLALLSLVRLIPSLAPHCIISGLLKSDNRAPVFQSSIEYVPSGSTNKLSMVVPKFNPGITIGSSGRDLDCSDWLNPGLVKSILIPAALRTSLNPMVTFLSLPNNHSIALRSTSSLIWLPFSSRIGLTSSASLLDISAFLVGSVVSINSMNA